jgi:hypothetical protein
MSFRVLMVFSIVEAQATRLLTAVVERVSERSSQLHSHHTLNGVQPSGSLELSLKGSHPFRACSALVFDVGSRSKRSAGLPGIAGLRAVPGSQTTRWGLLLLLWIFRRRLRRLPRFLKG